MLKLSVKKDGLEPILGAAYLMMDRAYVQLGGDRKTSITVALKSKSGGAKTAELEKAFKDELAAQKVRWELARRNQPIREYVAEQAVLVASGAVPAEAEAAAPASDQLTDEQRLEIEKLIAEVEEEIKAINQKKAVPDPKNIKASWEARQE